MYLYMYCEIYVVGDAGVRDGGHSGGNGDDDTNSKYSYVNLDDGGAGGITIKKKSNYT
jgi:hypothetical protein